MNEPILLPKVADPARRALGRSPLEWNRASRSLRAALRAAELAAWQASGNAPGATPMMVLNPAVGAARFVMAGHDLDRNMHQTAAQMAKQVAARCDVSSQMARSTAPATGTPEIR